MAERMGKNGLSDAGFGVLPLVPYTRWGSMMSHAEKHMKKR